MQGDGPAIVLIHGVGLDHTMWDLVAAGISNMFRVLRYDIVGHGRTQPVGDPLSFTDLTRQLEGVLETHGIQNTAVVGFSLGALIAQDFTLAHPGRVSKLVLLNSAYMRSSQQQAGILSRLNQVIEHGTSSNVEASIDRWFTAGFRGAHPEQISRVAETLNNNNEAGFLAAYRLFAGSDGTFENRLGEIRAPTLVITGECDVGSTPHMSRAIASQIHNSQVKIFPRVKHMLPVENADKLCTELLRFLH